MKSVIGFGLTLLAVTSCNTMPAGVYNLPEDETIEDVVSNGKITLISFTSPDNRACVESDSIFELVAVDRRGDARFVSVDVTQHGAIVDRLGVAALPAVLLVRGNGQRDWHIGTMTRDEINEKITEAEK